MRMEWILMRGREVCLDQAKEGIPCLQAIQVLWRSLTPTTGG
jgi:hypothetical protein